MIVNLSALKISSLPFVYGGNVKTREKHPDFCLQTVQGWYRIGVVWEVSA